jgi:hypothetical protein
VSCVTTGASISKYFNNGFSSVLGSVEIGLVSTVGVTAVFSLLSKYFNNELIS